MKKTNTKGRISAWLDTELIMKIKIRAIENGETLQDLVARVLTKEVAKSKSS